MELRLLTDGNYAEAFEAAENELMSQYLEDALAGEERIQFEQYFLKSPERRDNLAFTAALKKAAQAHVSGERRGAHVALPHKRRTAWPFFAPVYLKAAAVSIVAVGVVVGAWLLMSREPGVERGLADLRAAYRNQRLIEARVTSLDYAPLIVTRGPEDSRVDQTALRQAELQLLNNLRVHPDAKAEHNLGRFYLAGAEFEKAIENLEAARNKQPDDPQIQSDLGAALLEAGQQAAQRKNEGQAFTMYARSLQHFNGALRSNPELLEAIYNKALCLQHMKLPEQAKAAWQEYLARDSQSKWAEEARRNLQLLSERTFFPVSAPQLLESFRAAFREGDDGRAWQLLSRNREMITGRIIPPQLGRDHIASRLNGAEASAQESLRAFIFAGEMERQRGGDPYTWELAQYYSSLSEEQLRLITSASEHLRQGYRLCLSTEYGLALGHFEAARASYSKAGDIWEAKLADYWVGYSLTQLDRVWESLELLRRLAEFCEARSYKWLHAQAAYWLAVNYSIHSEYSRAIGHYRQSLVLAEAVSDTYLTQKALAELGAEYADLRQWESSLGFLHRGLSVGFSAGASPRQALRNFTTAASALFAFKYYDAAAVMCKEALALDVEELGDPSLTYVLHLNLGRIYIKLRRFEEANQQAELGMQIAQSAQDATAKRKLVATAQLQSADIRREAGNCGRALEEYGRAIELYEELEFDVYRYAAYKGRLLCALTRNDTASVERDLPYLLDIFERKRVQIREEQNRNSFFDAEQDVYDVAIEFEQGRQNYLKAIGYSESARARSLLDALQSNVQVVKTGARLDVIFSAVSSPSDVENIRQRLPAQVRVLLYTVLPKKLLLWDISRERITSYEREITAEVLEAEVNHYLNSLKGDAFGSPRPLRELSEKLYGLLLGQVEGELTPGQQVCIIPDKFLYQLPFAALVSPTTGKFFIEAHAVSYAPSLNVLDRCSEMASRMYSPERESVLSIGNPSFDSRAYPKLSNLPAAEREARAVAELYENATLLVGPQADKVSALAAMPSATVIHFAGHYLANEAAPLQSKMLMTARDSGGSGESVLHAFEILERRFERTRLIVLSACQTDFDTYYGGEGAVGLSRTFIAAGVPLVVASQWPVETAGTAELMIKFHQYRRAGQSTAEALRGAQLDMLRGSEATYRAPYYWAAFLCVGGNAGY